MKNVKAQRVRYGIFLALCATVPASLLACRNEVVPPVEEDGSPGDEGKTSSKSSESAGAPAENIDESEPSAGGAAGAPDESNGTSGSGGVGSETPPEAMVTDCKLTGLEPTRHQVSAGGSMACSVQRNRTLRCWGSGVLGNGTTNLSRTPVDVIGLSDVVAVSVDDFNACALLSSGQVACWGKNRRGEVGDGTTTQHLEPSIVPGITGATNVSVGGDFACAVLDDGQVLCWGNNGKNSLGRDTSEEDAQEALPPAPVAGVSNAIDVAGSCALLDNGTVTCWGSNDKGRYGNGSNVSNKDENPVPGVCAVSIASGGLMCAVTDSGDLYCWGGRGPGDGSVGTALSPVRVDMSAPVAQVTSASLHSCLVTEGGAAYCWGSENAGRLGNGSESVTQYTPVAVLLDEPFEQLSAANGYLTCGLTSAAEVYCWGNSLGLGTGASSNSNVPVLVPGLDPAPRG